MLNWVESIVYNNFAKCLLLTFVTGHTGSKKFGRKSEKSAKFVWLKICRNNGSYNWDIKREAVYKCTNKDYLPEAKPRDNDHFTCEAKPSKGKMHCPRA